MSWYLVVALLYQATTVLATHRDRRCDDDRCRDFFSQVAYCCGDRCCYYWRWYARWYFWFIVAMAIMILSGCITYWCKRSKVKHRRRVGASAGNRQTAIAMTTTTTASHHNPTDLHYQQNLQPMHPSDFPPTYQEIANSQDYKAGAFKNTYLPYDSGASAPPPPPYTYQPT